MLSSRNPFDEERNAKDDFYREMQQRKRFAIIITVCAFAFAMICAGYVLYEGWRSYKSAVNEANLLVKETTGIELPAFKGNLINPSALPKHNKTDFVKILHVPGINSLTTWKDENGSDCLAARCGTEIGFSEGQIVRIYDNKFKEIHSVKFAQASWAASSNQIVVKDITGDNTPEVFVGIQADHNNECVEAYDVKGNKLCSVSKEGGYGEHLIVANSPTDSAMFDLLIVDAGNKTEPISAFRLPNGIADSEDTTLFRSVIGEPEYFTAYSDTDWNLDGTRDIVFFSAGETRRIESLKPFCNGVFLDPVSLDFCGSNCYDHFARFLEGDREKVLAVEHGTLGGLAGKKEEETGNRLHWILPGEDEKTKKYTGLKHSYGEDKLVLADVTGDGIPEICTFVCDTALVILDLTGNELLNKEYFGDLHDELVGPEYLLSGDFDKDGLNDLAFMYDNGIWVPDLSRIRSGGR